MRGFGGRRIPLLGPALGVDESESLGPGQLKGENAPRVPEHPDQSVGGRRFHALFQVYLVETQRGHTRFRNPSADVGLELLDGRQIGQPFRIVHQMPERDEGMGLPPAVVDREFPVGLIAPARQAKGYVPDQLP